MLFFLIRALAQWHRSEAKRRRLESMNSYLTKHMRRYKAECPWHEDLYSTDRLEEAFRQIYTKPMKSLREPLINELLFPSSESPMNQIANSLNKFRDLRILSRIEKHWRAGKNLFIVYGGSHAIIQKAVIDDFTNCRKVT